MSPSLHELSPSAPTASSIFFVSNAIFKLVGETRPPNATPRLVFMPNPDDEGILSRLPDGEKDF
jgi:hypothetical protein